MTQHILQHYHQGVSTLTLNRPKEHNAFHPELIGQLIDALQSINNDTATRVVILSGSGDNFSAGADLHWMQQSIHSTEEENFTSAWQLSELMDCLYHLNKPTIALIKGKAMGGAIGLIACCDIAFATSEASFCFSEVKFGLLPAIISPYVIAAIGHRVAQRYFLTAEKFSAQTAQEIGLIHEVLPSAELLKHGQTIAQKLLENAPNAIEASKKLIKIIENRHLNIDYSLREMTARLIATTRVSEEAQAGLKAFLTKQQPPWQKEGN